MGYSTILVPVSNLYFDQAYSKNSEEPGFYWGSYVNTYSAFSFLPLNMFKMNQKTKNGHELSVDYFNDKTDITTNGSSNICGISASLFSETIKSSDDLEYLLFPKLLGLAERAWAPGFIKPSDNIKQVDKKLQKRWEVFANVLGQRELKRLSEKNINYRVPPKGIKEINDSIKMNSVFPGLEY
jgi:hexosaminidase